MGAASGLACLTHERGRLHAATNERTCGSSRYAPHSVSALGWLYPSPMHCLLVCTRSIRQGRVRHGRDAARRISKRDLLPSKAHEAAAYAPARARERTVRWLRTKGTRTLCPRRIDSSHEWCTISNFCRHSCCCARPIVSASSGCARPARVR